MLGRSNSGDDLVKMPSWDGAMVRGAAPEQQVLEPHQCASGEGAVDLVESLDAAHFVDGALLQVILQIAAHSGPVRDDGDAEAAEDPGRSHTGAVEE